MQPAPGPAQPAQPRFSGSGHTLGSGGTGQSRLLAGSTVNSKRPLSAAGRPATASARPDIDPSILAVQMAEIDGMLAAVADAPLEVLEPALELLIKMYTAIIDKPNEPKVRRIRWMNAKVQQHLANVPVAQDFLLASGFAIIQSPVEDTGESEDIIVFQEGSSLTLLSEVRGRLNRALAQARSAPRAAAAETLSPPENMSADAAGDSAMTPASPSRASAGAGADERPVSTHSATDFGAPGSDPSSTGVSSRQCSPNRLVDCLPGGVSLLRPTPCERARNAKPRTLHGRCAERRAACWLANLRRTRHCDGSGVSGWWG